MGSMRGKSWFRLSEGFGFGRPSLRVPSLLHLNITAGRGIDSGWWIQNVCVVQRAFAHTIQCVRGRLYLWPAYKCLTSSAPVGIWLGVLPYGSMLLGEDLSALGISNRLRFSGCGIANPCSLISNFRWSLANFSRQLL